MNNHFGGAAVAALAVAAAALAPLAAKSEECVATNIVVAPLTDSHWVQGAPYNDYSPLGWSAGCVAVAAAQEMRYWQWPWSLGAISETSHPVNNTNDLDLRFDGNVPFDWDNMPASFGSGSTLAEKHAAARLILACQSLVQMQFVADGGLANKNLPGTMEWYEYAGSVVPHSGDEAVAALREDMEFGSPVQTGINFAGYGGHEVVGLGFATGTNSVGEAKDLIYLNMGWGGGSDGWYDLAATSGTYVKNVQLGFRPIKGVQIEPVAPVSGSNVTLKWHLPNCYTNKIDGFAVVRKKMSPTPLTWTDDFSASPGRSSNSTEMYIKDGSLFARASTASAIYTYDEKFVLTADSVLTYDIGSAYMSGMRAYIEAKFDDGGWQRIHTLPLNGGRTAYYDKDGSAETMSTGNTVSLGAYAGKVAQLRVSVGYVSGGLFNDMWASMKIDNLSVSDVKMFVFDGSDDVAPDARTSTLTGLENGATYAFTVTPVMSDSSVAVDQTVTTVVGTPAASPTINSVAMSPKGTDLVQEGFYTDIAMGWNIIDVACSNVETLEAFSSHQSVLPQDKINVVNNGNGTFAVQIDASEVADKWDGQHMILTLKATNATGEAAYKDVELCLAKTGVPQNIPGGLVWTGVDAWNGEKYTDKWTANVLPSNGDLATFYVNDGDFGAQMLLNLSEPTTLGYVYATGLEQLMISTDASSETLKTDVLANDVQVEINTTKFEVGRALPLANIVIDSGSSLSCEVDSLRSDYIKKISGGYGYVSALTDSSLWKGTVVFSDLTTAGTNLNAFGSSASTVRLNGVSGYLAYNQTIVPTVELVDNGSLPALHWNNGSGNSTVTFTSLSGDGTFKTSGSGAGEKIIVNSVDDFAGSLNLSSKTMAIGTAIGTTANNGRLNVNSGNDVTIAGGKTWTVNGGVYLGGSQTFAVDGALTTTALSAEADGAVVAVAPTGAVFATSMELGSGTLRLAMAADSAATVSVTDAVLTGTTIEVSLADGMTVGNSVALMSASSFTGVDSATLTGLDGYELEVDNGVLYANKTLIPGTAIPGTVSSEPTTQSNVMLTASEEWAVIGSTPIFFTVPSNTNIFTVAFDAYIPDAAGTVFGFRVTSGTTHSEIKARRWDDGTFKGAHTGTTVMGNNSNTSGGDTVLTSGEHQIMVEYDHRDASDVAKTRGVTIYVDGAVVYHSGNLRWVNRTTTLFSIGGAAIENSATDVLTGLKVKNLTFFGGMFRDSSNDYRCLTVNGTSVGSVAKNIELVRLFGLTPVVEGVVIAVDDFSVGTDGSVTIGPNVTPDPANGTVVVQGSAEIGAAASWSDLKTLSASELENGVTLGAATVGTCRFFRLVVR